MELQIPFRDFLPEIILCAIAVLIIVLNIVGAKRSVFYVVIAGLLLQLFFVKADVFKIIICLSTLVTIYMSGRDQRMEYYLLILSVLLGAGLLMTSSGFIMIILSMEMISLSSYVLTAGSTPEKKRAEAAWKFFIYGSAATAIMIFGMTYLYGTTGRPYLSAIHSDDNAALLGSIMTVAGFLFKMTAAPFHLWAPDVYEATPTPIIAFLSVVPKLAAFIVVMQWSAAMDVHLTQTVLAVAAIFTIIVGTLAALNQSNAKRMMAYSSVAQAGFFLTILLTWSNIIELAVLYSIVFALMNFLVFIVIHQQEQSGRGTAIADFANMGYSNPLAAVAITLGLISLIGLPPMAGFMAKLFVFTSIWSRFSRIHDPILLTLFVVGLLATAASLYFYLKIPFYAFFRRTEVSDPIKISRTTNLLMLILVGLLLTLFFVPGLIDGLVI